MLKKTQQSRQEHVPPCSDDTQSVLEDWRVEKVSLKLWTQLHAPYDHEFEAEPGGRELALDLLERNASLLELEDDFDGMGSLAPSNLAWSRAENFLTFCLGELQDETGRLPPMPEIFPGPGRGIDVHWKREEFELLVKIPGTEDQLFSFYGDDYGADQISGQFPPGLNHRGLVQWVLDQL